MQPYVCDLSPYSLPKKLFYLLGGISTAEILTYPLDRMKTLLFVKPYTITRSFLGYKEMHLTYLEIMNIEKFFGFFFGLKAGFDRTFSLLLPKFIIFYYFLNHRKPESLSFLELIRLSVVSHSFGGLFVQLSNVLKIKLQADPVATKLSKLDAISMKYRAINEIYSKDPAFLFRCGLATSLTSINLTGLIEIFGFIAINKIMDSFNFASDKVKTTLSVLIASAIATTIANPLEFIHHRQVVIELKDNKKESFWQIVENSKKKSGLSVFYQGFLPNLMRNCCFNSLLVWILLSGIKFEERKLHMKDFMHQGRYSGEAS